MTSQLLPLDTFSISTLSDKLLWFSKILDILSRRMGGGGDETFPPTVGAFDLQRCRLLAATSFEVHPPRKHQDKARNLQLKLVMPHDPLVYFIVFFGKILGKLTDFQFYFFKLSYHYCSCFSKFCFYYFYGKICQFYRTFWSKIVSFQLYCKTTWLQSRSQDFS